MGQIEEKVTKIGNWVARLIMGDALQAIARIDERTKNLEKSVDEIKPDLREVRESFAAVKDRVNILWEREFLTAKSPLVLNEKGEKILENSGIKELVDTKREMLFIVVKDKNPQGAYQIQEFSREAMLNLKNTNPELLSALEDGAFKTGVDVDTVLLVGSFYLRDSILPEFGFQLSDIDSERNS
ncbi:MAG: hypothetical protein HYW00_00695 [Candidatus Colwellbacteria bacterium]|nr:hypothetical protein [Candidatus Colwellbacteria bacterium]